MKQKKKTLPELEQEDLEETQETDPEIEEWETDMPDAPEPEPPKKGLKAFFSKIVSSLVEEVDDDDDEEDDDETEEEIEDEEIEEEEEAFEEDFPEEEPEEDLTLPQEELLIEMPPPVEPESEEFLLDAPEDMPEFREEAVPGYQPPPIILEEELQPLEEQSVISMDELSGGLNDTLSDYDEEPEENPEDGETKDSTESDEEEDEEEEEELNPDGTPQKSFFSVAIPVAAVVAVALGFAYCLQLGLFDEKPVYYMPDLVGRSYYDLGEDYINFDIQVDQSDYSAYDKDVIYAQDVPPGTEVKHGQTVHVDLSLGYAMTPVPDVKNYQYAYAQKLLEQTGFQTEIVYEKSLNGTAPENVIRTVPGSNEEAVVGSKITLYVSDGLGADSAQVQNFTGMLLEDAKKLCEMYGLEVEAVPSPALEAANVVTSQSIEAGSSVPFHTIITLTYSSGEQPKGTVPYQVDFPAYASGRFILDFIDKDGNVIASSDVIIAGFSAGSSVPVEGYGSQEIKVILNNYTTNLQAELGTYHFDFTTGTYTVLTEDMQSAFEAVDGIA